MNLAVDRPRRAPTFCVCCLLFPDSLIPYAPNLMPLVCRYENLRGISLAGAGLLKWVIAMVNYNNVAKTGGGGKRMPVGRLYMCVRTCASIHVRQRVATDGLGWP